MSTQKSSSPKRFPKRKTLVLALSAVIPLVGFSAQIQAQESSEVEKQSDKYRAEPVVVVATRTAKTLNEAPSSVEVVTSETMDREGISTIAESLLDIPNVDVVSPESPVYSSISIRGSDRDQITYLIDGVRQDNYTMSGNRPAFIFVDPEMVKQVEVRRGGGSSLYGNGGIGGTLSVTTKTAQDLLKPGQSYGAKLKTGYNSASREWNRSAFVYGQHGIYDAVIGYSRRDGSKISLSNTGRRSATERDSQYDAVMAKLTVSPSQDNRFTFGYSYDKPQQWSGPANDRMFYELKQHRVTGSWDYRNGDWIDLKVNLQYSKMDNSYDNRTYNPEAYFSDEFESYSGNVQNTSIFELGGTHVLTYGFDVSQTKQHSKNASGLSDESRPDSEGLDAGVFIQDEYSLNDYLTITPVVRFSYYDRTPKSGQKDKYGLEGQTDSKVTPGITFTVTPTDELSVYFSAQTGYRPPFLDELYTAMDYADYGMYSVVLPNSNVKPEESLNLELGVNGDFKNVFAQEDKLSLRANVFRDKIKNLIVAGLTGDMEMTPGGDMILYYSIDNVGSALKKGFELSADYLIGNFDFHASYGYLHAEDEDTGEKIAGITPQQAAFRAGYTYHPWDLNAWYRLRAYKGGKSSEETVYGSGEYKDYAGFATHSIGASWTPEIPGFADIAINFAVDNIGNKKYRYLNGGYGYSRTYRTWISATF
ncbi:tonB-dependent heme/hemoglobin receptor family protein [Sutterella sp. CAG:521]|nr:tonB-dependent heme/hemoglobin receptor family protein [Sutterella sp. CAG:521]